MSKYQELLLKEEELKAEIEKFVTDNKKEWQDLSEAEQTLRKTTFESLLERAGKLVEGFAEIACLDKVRELLRYKQEGFFKIKHAILGFVKGEHTQHLQSFMPSSEDIDVNEFVDLASQLLKLKCFEALKLLLDNVSSLTYFGLLCKATDKEEDLHSLTEIVASLTEGKQQKYSQPLLVALVKFGSLDDISNVLNRWHVHPKVGFYIKISLQKGVIYLAKKGDFTKIDRVDDLLKIFPVRGGASHFLISIASHLLENKDHNVPIDFIKHFDLDYMKIVYYLVWHSRFSQFKTFSSLFEIKNYHNVAAQALCGSRQFRRFSSLFSSHSEKIKPEYVICGFLQSYNLNSSYMLRVLGELNQYLNNVLTKKKICQDSGYVGVHKKFAAWIISHAENIDLDLTAYLIAENGQSRDFLSSFLKIFHSKINHHYVVKRLSHLDNNVDETFIRAFTREIVAHNTHSLASIDLGGMDFTGICYNGSLAGALVFDAKNLHLTNKQKSECIDTDEKLVLAMQHTYRTLFDSKEEITRLNEKRMVPCLDSAMLDVKSDKQQGQPQTHEMRNSTAAYLRRLKLCAKRRMEHHKALLTDTSESIISQLKDEIYKIECATRLFPLLMLPAAYLTALKRRVLSGMHKYYDHFTDVDFLLNTPFPTLNVNEIDVMGNTINEGSKHAAVSLMARAYASIIWHTVRGPEHSLDDVEEGCAMTAVLNLSKSLLFELFEIGSSIDGSDNEMDGASSTQKSDPRIADEEQRKKWLREVLKEGLEYRMATGAERALPNCNYFSRADEDRLSEQLLSVEGSAPKMSHTVGSNSKDKVDDVIDAPTQNADEEALCRNENDNALVNTSNVLIPSKEKIDNKEISRLNSDSTSVTSSRFGIFESSCQGEGSSINSNGASINATYNSPGGSAKTSVTSSILGILNPSQSDDDLSGDESLEKKAAFNPCG